MILKTICLVIAFKSFIVFLSSRESFILITIRQVSRSCVGAFPLLICPGGFPCFTIGIVSHHLRRVIISDEISPKFRNEFHSQIWDPGISNFGSEDRNIKVRSNFIDKPCFLFSTTAVTVLFLTILKGWKQYGHDDTLSPAIVLGFRSIAVRILSDDDGDVCKSRAVTFSSLAMIHCFSQIQVNIIYLFCLWYKHKPRHEPLVACGWFHCLTTTNHNNSRDTLFSARISDESGQLPKMPTILVYGGDLLFPWSLGDGGVISKRVTISCDGKALFGLEEGETKFRANLITKIPTQRNKKRWDLLTVRQVPRGLRERFICGDLHQSTGFKALKICLLNGQMRILESSIVTKKETMVINEQRCIRRFKTHGQEPFQTTYHNFLSIKVMRKAFRSFIYMMIACYECMKRGLNRFFLLPVRLLLESRVTSTSSSKLGFNFLYLFQWLYLNGFMYHVSCKTFME